MYPELYGTPSHLRNVDWYYFVPDETDKYAVSLCNSSFDTTLGIFDEGLTEVVYNEDFCDEQSKLVLKGKGNID